MDNELLEKRETYHVSIRKNRKDINIDNRRKKFIGDILITPIITIDRQQYITILNQMILKINEQPNQEWNHQLQQLLEFIEKRQSYQGWSWSNLINRLVLVFQTNYLNLNLTSIGSKVLNMVLYKLQRTTSNTIILSMLQDNICQRLVAILNNKNILQLKQQLFLVGNILNQNGYIRNIFIENGIVKSIISFLNFENIKEEQLSTLLWISNSILVHYDDEFNKLKYSLGSSFLPIFHKIIFNYVLSFDIKRQIIHCLLNIAKRSNTQVQNIYSSQLITPIIQFAQIQQIPTIETWVLIKTLAQSNYEPIPNDMLFKGLPNLIDVTLSKDFIGQDSQNIKQTIYKTIYALIMSSPINCDTIMRSTTMMSHIIQGSNSLLVKYRAVNIANIKIMIQRLTYAQTQYLLKRYDILQIVTTNLKVTNISQVKLNCIKILIKLIQKYVNIYSGDKSNMIVKKLYSSYGIQNILEQLTNYKNQEVLTKMEQLLEILAQNYSPDES